MANIKSQIKRNRQNENRRMRNKSINSNLKTSVKKVESAAAAGEPTASLRQAQAKIDTAVSKGSSTRRPPPARSPGSPSESPPAVDDDEWGRKAIRTTGTTPQSVVPKSLDTSSGCDLITRSALTRAS